MVNLVAAELSSFGWFDLRFAAGAVIFLTRGGHDGVGGLGVLRSRGDLRFVDW